MSFNGPEPAVTALVDRLRSTLNTNIDAVNEEAADGLQVPQIIDEYVYPYMPQIGQLNQFPCVAVEHGPGKLEDDIGSSATEVYDLSVVVFVQSSEQDVLARYARRTMVAVVRSVMQDRNLGSGPGVPWGVICKRIDPGPALTRRTSGSEAQDPGPPQSYVTWAALTVEVRSDWD